jgi:hypothetical protein
MLSSVLFTCLAAFSALARSATPKAPTLTYLYSLNCTLAPAIPIGDGPRGNRVAIPITGGTFNGPRLNGIIRSIFFVFYHRLAGISYLSCTPLPDLPQTLLDTLNARLPKVCIRRRAYDFCYQISYIPHTSTFYSSALFETTSPIAFLLCTNSHSGTILNLGADWGLTSSRGTFSADTRYNLRTSDGANIFIQTTGPAQPNGKIYLREIFETGDERYYWLNDIIGVGVLTAGNGWVAIESWYMEYDAGNATMTI